MESKKENSDNSNKDDKKLEKKIDEPTKEDKDSEENLFLDFFSKSLLKEEKIYKDEEKEKKTEKKDEFNNNKKIFPKSTTNNESNYLSNSIKKLQEGDDMDIMKELISLSEHLSLSSDQIGDNPNMPKLLEEICNNLEKIYLPELIIYALQCMNYIFDINPGLTSVLKRLGIIPKMLGLITAMEDTLCLDYIVQILEKISYENALLLLESNVFLSLLNVIDFLGMQQRKLIMKICNNISVISLTMTQFKQYIKPGLEALFPLTKFYEENSIINEKAIIIYHNIIFVLNQGAYFNNNPELEKDIIKFPFLENFCDILKLYFFNNNNKITEDLIKKILKTINILLKVSQKGLDTLLSNKFLEILVEIINHEFNDVIPNPINKISFVKNDTMNTSKKSASFLSELFMVLIALFPEKKDTNKNKDDKILRKENEKYYEYLCINIIKPLVNNIMHKSACSTLSNLVKLVLSFSNTAKKEDIEKFLNSKQMAHIISKLLDTKYENYILDLISLLEILMEKAPEHFIQNFLREGIVENFRNYDCKPKVTKKPEKTTKKSDKKENNNNENENKEKDPNKEDSFSDILDKENKDYNDIYKDDYLDDNEYIEDEMQYDSGNEEEYLKIEKIYEKQDDKKEEKKDKKIDDKKDEKKDDKKDEKKDDKDKKDDTKDKEQKLADKNELDIKAIIEKKKEIFEKAKKLKEKELKLMNKTMKTKLEIRIKELNEKYLSEEKVKTYLEKIKSSELIQMKETLINLQKELTEECTKNDLSKIKSVLHKILQILSDTKNEITLFELENSGILIGLCNYFEPIFKEQYDKLNIENDSELQKTINMNEIIPNPIKKNEKIFEKTKLFLDCLSESKNKLIGYIQLLQYSITSMNCFTMILNDSTQNQNLNVLYNLSLKNVKKTELRILYSDELYKNNIEKNTEITDKDFKEKLFEYNKALIEMKEVKFLLSENSIVDDMTSILLSNTNVTFAANENYDVTLSYYLNIKNKDKLEKFDINEEWGIRDMKKALLKKYGRSQGVLYFNYPIYIGLHFKKKVKEDKKEDNQKEEDNIVIKSFLDYLQPFDDGITSMEKILDVDKISFIKEYHTSIIYSKSLYEIKRLMPSLFLLSILHLALKKYPKLFGINEQWFKNDEHELDELFINSKVNLLVSRASSDGSNISKSTIPSWCKNLIYDCGFITKYESRSLLFKVSFDIRRSLVNLQNYLKSIDPNYPNEQTITLEKSMRLKIIVDRDKILDHGYILLDDIVTSKFFGFLEFEYKGEIGNGLGPTLEFYSLIFEKLKEDKRLWYKTTDGSLYPKVGINSNKECIKLFKLLGYIIGRAIYDDRLIDIPISRVFWSLLLERPVLYKDMQIIDKDLFKTINDLLILVDKKKDLIKNKPNISDEEIENQVLYNGKKLSELDLYFTFPGNNEIELKEGGGNILLSMKNVEEYINLIYDFIFFKGIDAPVTAFRNGFSSIYSIYNLKCFTSSELEELVCGSLEIKWDQDNLYENLKPEHGYTKGSRIFNDLIKFMCKLDKFGQRQFLIFTTGTSRLPIGGFKALSPKLTIVKRTFDNTQYPDDYLPTVMTCQNYLKLPEYSTYEILESKLFTAMKEGSKEFNLS